MKITEKNRSWLRSLSFASFGIGTLMALAAAGTSDYRDQLQYADEETRICKEKEIASEATVDTMLGASFVMLGAAAAGLHLTEKNSKQR